MTTTVKQMLTSANAVIDTITVKEAMTLFDSNDAVFVDIRDASERTKNGAIPGAVHAPRGHLEFHADPATEIHKPIFSSGESLVLYCASGGRSTLATKTLLDMGITNVAHIAGGFSAWKEAGGAVEITA